MSTASAVRRYRDDPVDDAIVQRCLTAATWAPSGGNQQPWRFIVVDSPALRQVITAGARRTWESMRDFYGIEEPAAEAGDPKSRVLRAMAEHMRRGGDAPVIVVFCVHPQAGASDLQQGGSIFPAMQNFLLAARAEGLGAAVTLWYQSCEDDLRAAVGIPADWQIAALVTAGWPQGAHRTVRRKPLSEVAARNDWQTPFRCARAEESR
ncbi:nitroreductase family protein [Mycolicibacterium sp. 120266]|nr:nitroreductase family protein [Mycolicibacterium sp. 120266]MDX1873838.1 nitroreductase family protein [Mycolicibacterium sp. 120266]